MDKLQSIRRKSGGFTLVELLVVIAIIGVLATLVLLQLGTARARARDTKRITDVNQIRSAVEQYFEDNGGKYPDTIDQTTIGKYLTHIPTDPLDATKQYGYHVSPNKFSFQIVTELENTAAALGNDSDIKSSDFTNAVDADAASNKETCPDSDITNGNCLYDQGVKP